MAKPSSAVVKVVAGAFNPEYAERELVKLHFRSRGKIELTPKAKALLKTCEEAQQIILAHRGDIVEARKQIKIQLKLSTREQVSRVIEDAEYIMGAMFVTNKSYQRLMMHHDIEEGIKLAIAAKDLKGYDAMLKLKMRLYQLDLPDDQEEFNWFEKVVIYQQFLPEQFKHTLRPGYDERIKKRKLKLMQEAGVITDVSYTESTDDGNEG